MFQAERYAELNVAKGKDDTRPSSSPTYFEGKTTFQDFHINPKTGEEDPDNPITTVKIAFSGDLNPVQDEKEELSMNIEGQPASQKSPIWFSDLAEKLKFISPALKKCSAYWRTYYEILSEMNHPDPGKYRLRRTEALIYQNRINVTLEDIEFSDAETADTAITALRMDAAMNVALDRFKVHDAKRKTIDPVPKGQFDPANRTPIAQKAIEQGRWDKVPDVFKEDHFYPLLDTETSLASTIRKETSTRRRLLSWS